MPPYFILSHEKLVALSAAVAQGELGTNLLPRNLPSKRAVRLALAIERGMKIAGNQLTRNHDECRHTLKPTGSKLASMN